MCKEIQTVVEPLKIKMKTCDNNQTETVKWIEKEDKSFGDKLMRNIAVASSLILCIVALRTSADSEANSAVDYVLAAASDHSLLDDQLGKLSFVSSLFPETVLVFGETRNNFSSPVIEGELMHTWSQSEPYSSWRSNTCDVFASCSGEVIGVYHGNSDERLLQIMDSNGISVLYGNLKDVYVHTGDYVESGMLIACLAADDELYFEIRQNGISMPPSQYSIE